jgi:serine/threonine protein kinase
MHFLRKTFPRLFPRSSPVAGARIHEWKVVQFLGEGRNGLLYLVKRKGRLFTMKWLASAGEESEALAQRELFCWRGVSAPHFAALEAFGRWPDKQQGTPYLVLEHVPGPSLAQWCRQPGPSAMDVTWLIHRLMRAVSQLNDQNVRYPSLMCEDVKVRENNNRPVITDLGGALPIGRPLTETELSQDVQALGAILYELLTHYRPGPLPLPPHLINPRVPLELSELTMRLL